MIDASYQLSLTDNPSYDPDYQVPCTAGWEFITPELAKAMLGRGNRKNRKLTQGHVDQLTGVLNRDEWMFDSTDAIGIATDEAVVNGQHRLETIAQSDRGVWCLVVRGVRPTIINVIDQGSARSLSQTLAIDGTYADPTGVSSAVEFAHKIIGGYVKTQPQAFKPSILQLLDWLVGHPEIVASLEPAKEVHAKLARLRVGMLAAYHYAFSCADPDLADLFYEQLATGLDVGDSDPVYTLRERLLKDQSAPTEKQLKPWHMATFLVRAWEATRGDEKIPAAKMAKPPVTATEVPTVSDVDWLGTADGPVESAEVESDA